MRHAIITGTGLYAPGPAVGNEHFDRLYGRDVSGFLRRERNIHARHFMADGENPSDMAVAAARQALAAASLRPADVDMIIVATDTPDFLSPATAAVVQRKLGAGTCGTFDVNAACAGFVTALDTAYRHLASNRHLRHVLVAGTYGMSRFLDWDDHKIATLFADGAGAVVLSAREARPGDLWEAAYHTDGQYHDFMGIYGGAASCPGGIADAPVKTYRLDFRKKIPLETNITHWPRLTRALLERAGMSPRDIGKMFLTQINIKLIEETLDALELPRGLSHNVMDRFGYTGSACLPMALHDAVTAGTVARGDRIVMLGSGGGVAIAGLLFTMA